ncbi:MAG: hypothetical protein LH702_02920 [Phormidesmis sp. CAN_BIN44]|nr:hypothetical protein [Phormidesmis sp. CAN_BIN44]
MPLVSGIHPPVIENHGLTVRSPLKGLGAGLSYSVRFNGLRTVSPDFSPGRNGIVAEGLV